MPIQINVSSEKLQTENSFLQLEFFSDVSGGACLAGMSLFGGKNAPNTTPKCFQTQHRRRILEVEVPALKSAGEGRAGCCRAKVKGQNDTHWIIHTVGLI